MNETMARSLTPKELAEEFRYHTDPGVSRLALSVIEHDPEVNQEIMEQSDERAEILEGEVKTLTELLLECSKQLPERCKELRERIVDATR